VQGVRNFGVYFVKFWRNFPINFAHFFLLFSEQCFGGITTILITKAASVANASPVAVWQQMLPASYSQTNAAAFHRLKDTQQTSHFM